jgi:hypothetical protein
MLMVVGVWAEANRGGTMALAVATAARERMAVERRIC